MTQKMKIKLIIGSTRPNRFGPKPAQWLYDLARQRDDAEYELIDLHRVGLPFLDEPEPALSGRYANDHTKAWARTIAEADGLVFITSEYNHSYPAALKNAIDFLAAEWYYKPLGLVSYGAAQGGARAAEHLRGVAAQLKMYDLGDSELLGAARW
jgi:NAD(P)H-dependent FMN reductase